MPLIDAYSRRIDYLRLSITDHCNLNCLYCMPYGGRAHLDRSEILSCKEIFRVAQAAVSAGISKIRITGGEPLVRRGVSDLCGLLVNLKGVESVSLTTNGVLLPKFARPLFEAGVKRINVSLDSLKEGKLKKITGNTVLGQIKSGIELAHDVGLRPVKINVVVMRGVNDDEIEEFARLTLEKPYHVRFIELMPTKALDRKTYGKYFVPANEILRKIKRVGELRRVEDGKTDSYGPAELFRLSGGAGMLGFISPVSRHFCGECNRMRFTADGALRPCLFSDKEINVKTSLRKGATTEELAEVFRLAVTQKPHGHELVQSNCTNGIDQSMCAIGG